jgi:hypothetical protein
MRDQNTTQAIAMVKASAELYHAQQIARGLSISSKNLRSMAMRIGQRAAGLAVLASFYEEFSAAAILIANDVSTFTLTNAKSSVDDWRRDLFEQHLQRAETWILDTDKPVPELVKKHLVLIPDRRAQQERKALEMRRTIRDALDDMQKKIRSIAVIAVNSKIEAPKTGSHSDALLAMANHVEKMVNEILAHIDGAAHCLKQSRQKPTFRMSA